MTTAQALSATMSATRKLVDALNAKRAGAAISVKGDVANPTQVQALLDQTVKAFGKIDMVLRCAS